MADDDPSNDETVGYCKPPRRNQFPPGKSGNPRGRPVKRKSDAELFREIAKMRVKMSDNGRKRTIPTDKAVFLKLRRAALEGDPWAIKEWIRLAREHEPSTPNDIIDDILAEDKRLLAEFEERQRPDAKTGDDDGEN